MVPYIEMSLGCCSRGLRVTKIKPAVGDLNHADSWYPVVLYGTLPSTVVGWTAYLGIKGGMRAAFSLWIILSLWLWDSHALSCLYDWYELQNPPQMSGIWWQDAAEDPVCQWLTWGHAESDFSTWGQRFSGYDLDMIKVMI